MNIRRFLLDASLVLAFTLPTWKIVESLSNDIGTAFVLWGAALFLATGVMYAKVVDNWGYAFLLGGLPVVAGMCAATATVTALVGGHFTGAFALLWGTMAATAAVLGIMMVGWVRKDYRHIAHN
jgi:hypothetical protein